MSPYLVHASCVAINGRGVLLAGGPGVGKSAMALRLIDGGAELVADDQTELWLENGRITASPPDATRGLIEVRFLGLMRLPFCPSAPVALYVDLVPNPEGLERLPEPDQMFFLDRPIRRLRLPSYEDATPAKIRAAMLFECVEPAPAGECP